MSLCYVLAQYKVLGKGGILCRIHYIPLSPMFGWAGIREERASALISYTPQYVTWSLMYSKTGGGKYIFKKHNLLFLYVPCKKHCKQLLPRADQSLYA